MGGSGLVREGGLSVVLGVDEWSAEREVGQYGFVVLSGEKEAVQRGMAAVISIADRGWTFATQPQYSPHAQPAPVSYPPQSAVSAPYLPPAPVAAAKPPPLLPYPTTSSIPAATGPVLREPDTRPMCYMLLGCQSRNGSCPCACMPAVATEVHWTAQKDAMHARCSHRCACNGSLSDPSHALTAAVTLGTCGCDGQLDCRLLLNKQTCMTRHDAEFAAWHVDMKHRRNNHRCWRSSRPELKSFGCSQV